MKKLLIFVFVLFVGTFLVACSSQSQPAETPTAVVQEKETEPVAQMTAEVAADENTEASCTVRASQPTPGPTEQALLPPPADTDWVVGPDNAYITLIEYGDYQ